MKLKKDMRRHAPLVAIVVGGLLVMGLGWKLVVSPQGHKAASLDAQTAAVEQQITTNLAQVAAAKAAPVVPKIRVADVYKLAKAIPSSPDVPNLLIELSQVTRDAGVNLQSLSPAPPSASPGGSTTVPITLTADGDFFTITDLLYRLRNLVFVRAGALEATGRLFAIDSVSLSPSTGKGLTATVNMHGYVYGAPAATTATPPPTDTTATTTSTDTSSAAPSAAGAP